MKVENIGGMFDETDNYVLNDSEVDQRSLTKESLEGEERIFLRSGSPLLKLRTNLLVRIFNISLVVTNNNTNIGQKLGLMTRIWLNPYFLHRQSRYILRKKMQQRGIN